MTPELTADVALTLFWARLALYFYLGANVFSIVARVLLAFGEKP